MILTDSIECFKFEEAKLAKYYWFKMFQTGNVNTTKILGIIIIVFFIFDKKKVVW